MELIKDKPYKVWNSFFGFKTKKTICYYAGELKGKRYFWKKGCTSESIISGRKALFPKDKIYCKVYKYSERLSDYDYSSLS